MDDDIMSAKVAEALRAAMQSRSSLTIGEAQPIIAQALEAFMGPPPEWDIETTIHDDLTFTVSVRQRRAPSLN